MLFLSSRKCFRLMFYRANRGFWLLHPRPIPLRGDDDGSVAAVAAPPNRGPVHWSFHLHYITTVDRFFIFKHLIKSFRKIHCKKRCLTKILLAGRMVDIDQLFFACLIEFSGSMWCCFPANRNNNNRNERNRKVKKPVAHLVPTIQRFNYLHK